MANLIYQPLQTVKVFKSSGGDAVITPTSVADAAGRLSAQLDLTAGSIARRFAIGAKTKWAATPTLKKALRIYIIPWYSVSDSAGDFGSGDAAISDENQLLNAEHVLSIVCDEAGTNAQKAVSLGTFIYPWRYISVVIWNAGGAALSSTATDTEITLIPVPDEIQ